MKFTAIVGQCTLCAAGNDKVACYPLQRRYRFIQVPGVAPAQRLFLVAEHEIDTITQHFLQAVAEEFHHARVRQAERGFNAGGLGHLARPYGRRAACRGCHQVTFDVEVLRGGDGLVIEFVHGQGLGDAGSPAVDQAVVNAGGFQVGHVDVAVGVVCHLAAHKGRAAELGGCDHGIARAAATGVAGFYQVALQMSQQLGLTVLVHQCHHAFLDTHLVQLAIFHFDLGVDQRRTHAINLVLLHPAGTSSRTARHYPDSTSI